MIIIERPLWLALELDWRAWYFGFYFDDVFAGDWLVGIFIGPLQIELGSGLEDE